MPEAAKVNTPCNGYQGNSTLWKLIDDILGGTAVMRENCRDWLPQEPKETLKSYRIRVSRSFLFNAVKDTMEKVVSKPFSRPVTLTENVPQKLEEIAGNCDLAGRDLTQFFRDVFKEALKRGLTHVLIDMPSIPDNARPRNLAEERDLHLRPVFVHIKPEDLIAWKTRTTTNGELITEEIRFRETRTEPVGAYGEQDVEYIRVYTPDRWELHRKHPDSKEFVKTKEGPVTYPGPGVPIRTLYFNRTAPYAADPPLTELAWTNLAHFQSDSDQRNILRFTRFGILFAAGFSPAEIEAGIVIGPNKLVASANENATLKYVESQDAASNAGVVDIKHLEERLVTLGLQPFVSKSGGQTATAKSIDEAKVHSNVQAWARATEAIIGECYEDAAKWVGVELPDDFSADVNNDFGISARAGEDVKNLIAVRAAGDITRETYLKELRRRDLLSEAVDIEVELENVKAEGPPAGTIMDTGPAPGDDPGDDPDDDDDNPDE